MSSEISESYQNLVRQLGDRVDIHTQVCVEWKLEHKNCGGCPSELGCSKVVTLLLVSMSQMGYQPQGYDDYERMQQAIQGKMDKILRAKSTAEVKAIV